MKVEPIRDLGKIEEIKQRLKVTDYRNYLLFIVGIYLGRRISDIRIMKVGDLKADKIKIKEKKTGKPIYLPINEEIRQAATAYSKAMKMDDDEYIFKSKTYKSKGENKGTKGNVPDSKGDYPLSRFQAYKIINEVCRACGIPETDGIGTHTLRKTFGYHFYQQTHDVATLQMIFNHSSQAVTLQYIGINSDMIMQAVKKFNYDYNKTT